MVSQNVHARLVGDSGESHVRDQLQMVGRKPARHVRRNGTIKMLGYGGREAKRYNYVVCRSGYTCSILCDGS
jgi:hypothetical protein